MAYKILNTDGSTLLLLADGEIDRTTTSLSLIGRNSPAYGENLNNNFIKLLACSASPTALPPINPLLGQLWYDTTARRLKVYDNIFKTLSGAIVSSDQPLNLSSGDLWFDSNNNQLKILSGNVVYVVGPSFSKLVGNNGWILPPVVLNNINNIPQQVTLLKNYGITVGMMTTIPFELSPGDSELYFNTSTHTLINGLTIIGDIEATGQITNKFLSMTVDIDKIAPQNSYVNNYSHVVIQNVNIIARLSLMFSVIAITATNDVGVPIGAEARVLCDYTLPSIGYEVRRFRLVDQVIGGPTWQPYDIYPGNIAGHSTSNVVQ